MATLDEILATLGKAAEEIITLKVKTCVGSNISYDDKNKIIFNAGDKAIITEIDLLQGDITTFFNEELLKPEYDKIRDYHAEKVQQGSLIIQNNIKALSDILELIKKSKAPAQQ